MAKRAARLATTMRLRTFALHRPGASPKTHSKRRINHSLPHRGRFRQAETADPAKAKSAVKSMSSRSLPPAIAAIGPVIATRPPPAHPAAAVVPMAADIGDVFQGGAVDGSLDARRRANG